MNRGRRPRWLVRVVLLGGVLFAVFCAAAGATLWFKETRKTRPLPAAVEPDAFAEHLSQEERDALGDLLKKENPPKQP